MPLDISGIGHDAFNGFARNMLDLRLPPRDKRLGTRDDHMIGGYLNAENAVALGKGIGHDFRHFRYVNLERIYMHHRHLRLLREPRGQHIAIQRFGGTLEIIKVLTGNVTERMHHGLLAGASGAQQHIGIRLLQVTICNQVSHQATQIQHTFKNRRMIHGEAIPVLGAMTMPAISDIGFYWMDCSRSCPQETPAARALADSTTKNSRFVS